MAADMAKELRPHNVAAVSIWMGALYTERARAYTASSAPEARPTAERESPQFTSQVISAVYASDNLIKVTSRAEATSQVCRRARHRMGEKERRYSTRNIHNVTFPTVASAAACRQG
jgi:hypothetical protein